VGNPGQGLSWSRERRERAKSESGRVEEEEGGGGGGVSRQSEREKVPSEQNFICNLFNL